MFTSRTFRRAVTGGIALAISAGALLAGATAAFADTPDGPEKCHSGSLGVVCTEVMITPGGLRYAYAYSQAPSGHQICLEGVALYVVTGSGSPVLYSNNNNEICGTDNNYFSLTSSPQYRVECFGVAKIAYTAVRYTVDSGVVERFQSDPVKVC